MRFAFSDEQREFQRALRGALEKECPPARLRAAWDSADGQVPGLWAKLAELGVLGLAVPEAYGGMGMDELDLVLVLEEVGRAALPGPVAATAAVAAPLLCDVGETRWLADIAAGRTRAVVALDDALVDGAGAADLVLVARDDELHAPARGALRLEAAPSVDGARRLARLCWTPSADTLIARDAGAALAAAFDRAALAAAAELLGLARHLLAVTVEYVKVRKQFDKPIGSFQAVKHHLADAAMAIEFAAPVVYRAAYSIAHADPARALHVSMAKAFASDAAQLAVRKALQCHGAMGYAFEYDLHLWMKRAWALARSAGDAAWHRARVAAHLLETEAEDGRGIHHRRGQDAGGQAQRGPVQGAPGGPRGARPQGAARAD